MKISNILHSEELLLNPPVLVDFGASGCLLKNWKSISKYSICFGFDAGFCIPNKTGNLNIKLLEVKNLVQEIPILLLNCLSDEDSFEPWLFASFSSRILAFRTNYSVCVNYFQKKIHLKLY